jgi:Amt family ammonium transporter
VIKKAYGLRVTEHEEDAGLDISEHGMYGYPEQFIPEGEFPGAATSPTAVATAATSVRPAANET